MIRLSVVMRARYRISEKRIGFEENSLLLISLNDFLGAHYQMSQNYIGPILDSHIHLFDPSRPDGIPWPNPSDSIYSPHLPPDYWRISERHGITAAIAVEASPWVADNHWLLDVVKADPQLSGFIGNLDPATKEFRQELEWLVAEPKFLGLRYGNLWGRDLLLDQDQSCFIDNLSALADSGRSLDTANPDERLLKGVLRLSEKLPHLRIIVDHLPNAAVPPGKLQSFANQIQALAERPNVFAKLSALPQKKQNTVILDAAFYRDRMALLWDAFGEDRCLFGSDWPNSEFLANFEDTLSLVHACLADRSLIAKQKFFYLNSARAYSISLPAR